MRPLLGHHAARRGRPASRCRAPRSSVSTVAPACARRLGDRRRGLGRFGAAVGRRVQRGDEAARRAGHQRVDRGAAQQPRIHLILARLGQPRLLRGDLLLGLAQIGDAGLAKAGVPVGARVHAAPQAQALDRQRDFASVAPHGAAPAPVAAGLLAADAALLAQHDRVALLGQEQRGAGADDAAADDDHPGAIGKAGVGLNKIDWGRHAMGRQHMLAQQY